MTETGYKPGLHKGVAETERASEAGLDNADEAYATDRYIHDQKEDGYSDRDIIHRLSGMHDVSIQDILLRRDSFDTLDDSDFLRVLIASPFNTPVCDEYNIFNILKDADWEKMKKEYGDFLNLEQKVFKALTRDYKKRDTRDIPPLRIEKIREIAALSYEERISALQSIIDMGTPEDVELLAHGLQHFNDLPPFLANAILQKRPDLCAIVVCQSVCFIGMVPIEQLPEIVLADAAKKKASKKSITLFWKRYLAIRTQSRMSTDAIPLRNYEKYAPAVELAAVIPVYRFFIDYREREVSTLESQNINESDITEFLTLMTDWYFNRAQEVYYERILPKLQDEYTGALAITTPTVVGGLSLGSDST